MSTDERATAPVRRRSRPALSLPSDPSDEALARDWTLSAADKGEIQACRGDDNRLRFALQRCVLRLYGRFLSTYGAVPLRIVNHLGRQLGLPPMLLLDPMPRPATESEYQQRLRAYLGYQPFGPDSQTSLEQQLTRHAQDGMSGDQLSIPCPPRRHQRTFSGFWTRQTCTAYGPRPRCTWPTPVATAALWSKASLPACCLVEQGTSPIKAIAARSSRWGWRSWRTTRRPWSASTSIACRSGRAHSAVACA